MFGFKPKGKSGIEYHSVWRDVEDGFLDALPAYLGDLFGCRRVCTFERAEDDTYSCTVEWCSDKVTPIKNNFQNMNWIDMMPWIEIHKAGSVTIIENIDSIKEEHPELHSQLRIMNCSSMITGSFDYLGEDLGFWIATDPPLDKIHQAAAIFQGLYNMMGNIHKSHSTIEELKDIGFTDKLTGVANRNALTKNISTFPLGASLMILFADLNGMKEINDNEGHEAGDRFLIKACGCMKDVFPPESIYRIGGDEFLVIISGLDPDFVEAGEQLLRQRFKDAEVGVAIGVAYTDAYDGDFESLRAIADDLMYKDKRSSYKSFDAENEASATARADEVMEVYPQQDGYRVLFCIPHKYEGRGGRAKEGIFSTRLHEYADRCVHPSDKLKYLDFWNLSSLITGFEKSGGEAMIFKYRSLTVDGYWCWVEEQVSMIRRDGGKIVLIASLRDITEQRPREEVTEELSEQSNDYVAQRQLDLNRSFTKTAEDWLSTRRPGSDIVVAAVNLGHLRLYNDTFGRSEGDKILAMTGNIVSKAAEEMHGKSAYLGGDNYCLIGTIPDKYRDIYAFAAAISQNLESYNMRGGFAPSIGIYHTRKSDESFTAMHDKALIALSTIREDYRKHVNIYGADGFRPDESLPKVQLLDIQEGLSGGEFHCYLQPVVDITTGRVVSSETLIRWKKDDQLLKAERFIEPLEDSGYILAFDVRFWEQICSWQRSLIDRGVRPLPCSMNVSAVDFHFVNVADMLIKLASRYDLDPGLLAVELSSKTWADDPDTISDQVVMMRKAGLKVYLDDSGSGLGSYNSMTGARFDAIKMHKDYIDASFRSEGTISPLKIVLEMGAKAGIPVIAEGVETATQLSNLKELGGRYAQGNLLYYPMTAGEYEKLLIKEMKALRNK